MPVQITMVQPVEYETHEYTFYSFGKQVYVGKFAVLSLSSNRDIYFPKANSYNTDHIRL